MKICHVALGGCLTAPTVQYGVTEDTGGHIAYILGAATAQIALPEVDHVEIVTRAFSDPALDPVHAITDQAIYPKLSIYRLTGPASGYLSKEALAAEVPALTQAFLTYLAIGPCRPDVIHAHFADAATLALAARDRFGIPVVYTPHSLGLSKQGGRPAATRIAEERRALTDCDATVVSSRDESDRQVTAYGAGLQARVHRLRPGVTVERKPDAPRAMRLLSSHLNQPGRPMILAIARPVRRKNLSGLAQVYMGSKALQARANLVILAGQHAAADANPELADELDALRAIARRPGLHGKIALPDRHDTDTVKALYAAAAEGRGVFANLAHHEPFGLTLLEAAAHGLPVVATDAGGPCDIVQDLSCGRCVPVEDENKVEAALLSLLTDPEAWTAASGGGKRGIDSYDWSKWAQESVDLYRGLRTRRRPRSFALLASDIDHTLTGCAESAARFAAWIDTERPHFAVVTGRSIGEARRVLGQWRLPEPDTFVTSVGSEIYLRDWHGRLTLDRGYARALDADWDRAGIVATLKDLAFVFQPAVEQRRWKVSGYGTGAVADRLRRHLADRGIAARVIASHDRLIDVLPRAGGKGNAVAALMKRLKIAPRDTVVAGDSGNDLDMLACVGRPGGAGHGIVVANALPELRDYLPDRNIHYSTAAYAAGVLDGLTARGFAADAAPLLEAAE